MSVLKFQYKILKHKLSLLKNKHISGPYIEYISAKEIEVSNARDVIQQLIQLLEALDWKLMHESDSSMMKEDNNISNIFCSNQNQESKKLSSIQDEKSLSFSLDEQERLQK